MSHSKVQSRRKLLAMLAYLFAALAGAIGQFCFKTFSQKMPTESAVELAQSPYLYVGALSYFAVMVLFIVGLRLWGEMSTLYPIYGSTFVWALLIAVLWLGESISITGIAGTALIIVGIALLNAKTSTVKRGGP